MELLTDLIVTYILRRGVRPEFSKETIEDDVLRILKERWDGSHVNDIQYHAFPVVCPLSWTDYDERLWRDWLEQTFTYESWEDEVMYTMYGTNSEPWESSIPGWREELYQFLWTWIRRDPEIVSKFDPFPEIHESDEDDVKLKIDPYILEHGSAKQKRAALKGIHLDITPAEAAYDERV